MTSRCTAVITALLPLLLASCVPLVGEPAADPPVRAVGDPEYAPAVSAAILAESNRIRAALGGWRTMLHDPELHRAAQDYAHELARRQVLDHTSPTPGRRTMTQRVAAAGVGWSRLAENLGQLPGPLETLPRRVVQLWLDSPPHRGSLLDPVWTHSAVGIAADDVGYYYVVQLYLLPPRLPVRR